MIGIRDTRAELTVHQDREGAIAIVVTADAIKNASGRINTATWVQSVGELSNGEQAGDSQGRPARHILQHGASKGSSASNGRRCNERLEIDHIQAVRDLIGHDQLRTARRALLCFNDVQPLRGDTSSDDHAGHELAGTGIRDIKHREHRVLASLHADDGVAPSVQLSHHNTLGLHALVITAGVVVEAGGNCNGLQGVTAIPEQSPSVSIENADAAAAEGGGAIGAAHSRVVRQALDAIASKILP